MIMNINKFENIEFLDTLSSRSNKEREVKSVN
jgi:hypothetical protein